MTRHNGVISTSQARAMYFDLKRELGRRRALKVTGCTARGYDEKDLMRCGLPLRVTEDICLMHEKYIQGINHGREALDHVWL